VDDVVCEPLGALRRLLVMRRFGVASVALLTVAACSSQATPRSTTNAEAITTTMVPASTSTTDMWTTTTTFTASVSPSISSISLDQPVSLRVLAIRPNNPSLAVLDFLERTTTVYPPGAHALPRDATDGAVSTPNRDWIIWTNGVARLFAGSLDHVDLVLGPSPPREISGFAPALRVIPTPDGDRAWLVQPGITFGDNDYPTLVELVTMTDGESLLSLETDGTAFPVAATNDGLVLNTHSWFDTGDGFTVEPGSEVVVHLSDDGTTVRVGEGIAVAASPTRVIRTSSNRLFISASDGSDEVEVAAPFDGTWIGVGGPMIPSSAMPLQTLSPDGTEMLIGLGRQLDVNGTPADSELIGVSLMDGSTRTIAEFEGPTPFATWSSDGNWIALLWQKDITLINSIDPETVRHMEDVVPPDHFPLAAG